MTAYSDGSHVNFTKVAGWVNMAVGFAIVVGVVIFVAKFGPDKPGREDGEPTDCLEAGQAALCKPQGRLAAGLSVVSGALFLVWMIVPNAVVPWIAGTCGLLSIIICGVYPGCCSLRGSMGAGICESVSSRGHALHAVRACNASVAWLFAIPTWLCCCFMPVFDIGSICYCILCGISTIEMYIARTFAFMVPLKRQVHPC